MTQKALPNLALIRKINVLDLLLITVCTCAVSYLSRQTLFHTLFVCMLFALAAVLGYARPGIKFLLVYLVSHVWLNINLRYGISFPSPMMFAFIIELTPIMMPAYLAVQAPSGKLTVGLRQLPIPSKVLLTVLVILRFMPTMLAELSDVRDAMRTRGFLRSPVQVLSHPLTTLEYVVVPMVFRSLRIADELASSCIVRGIESPCKKQGYYVNRMQVGDVVLMAVFLATTVLFIVL
jgi:energy-coupling factor transport system permease protein